MFFAFFFVLCAVNIGGIKEGDSCTKEGVAGVCANIRVCPDAQKDIENRKHPQLCEFGGLDPTVCCISFVATTLTVLGTTERTPVSSTSSIAPDEDIESPDKTEDRCESLPPTLTSEQTGQKAWDKCLEYQNKLVYPCVRSHASGGFSRSYRCRHDTVDPTTGDGPAAHNEFPHIALLGYGDNPSNLQWLCSGALISDKFILTAGHCTSSRDGGEVTYVQLGTLRRSSTPAKNSRRVKNIVKHPEYKAPHRYHDIALLELEKPVPLDEFTVPACVHTGAALNASRATITGWALTAYDRDPSDNLQKMSLTEFKASKCAATYKPSRLMLNGFDGTSQICYGDKEMSRDACQGDIGGPLQIKNEQIACMYTVLGVTSSATLCGPGLPGIYARVAPYLEWIETTVWP